MADVLPLLLDDCGGCHGASGGFTVSGIEPALAYQNVLERIEDRGDADGSRFLKKAINRGGHGGGGIWVNTEDCRYRIARAWVADEAHPGCVPE